MKRFDLAVLIGAVAIVAGGGGFALGHFTATKAPTTASAQSGSGAGGGFGGSGGGHRFGGRPVFGTVASLSGNTLTITGADGTAHTVTLSSSTTYTNGDRSSATQAALTTGTSVAAFGQAASDGTITATRILINPQTPSGGAGSGSGAPSDSGAGSN